MTRQRILTGDRPTGPLHLGHYVGSLKNRIRLQTEYDTFIIIADIQVLGDQISKHANIESNIFEVVCDYIAVGIDPDEVNIFVQSKVPALAELSMFFGFLVNVSRLDRNPTIKSEKKMYGVSQMSVGFYTYPISQAADILGFKAHLVPVGQDQTAHIEQTREVARDFNKTFGEVFPLPEALIGECPTLPGTDGNSKMSKSLNNNISFAMSEEEVNHKIFGMLTDASRVRASDPGHPEICTAFMYRDLFCHEGSDEIADSCRKGTIGCKDCKRDLAKRMNEFLSPIRERRIIAAQDPGRIIDIIVSGTRNANEIVSSTLEEAKEAMQMSYKRYTL